MDLIDRKYRILQAIIDDYIMTALPVGSRTISRKYEQKLSSATIRNEMSDLEELGYLDSPHTSAGRIPSYKAYRLYVDRMIHPMPLSEEETAFIKSCFDHRINQVEELSARIAKALSSMTHYTTAVMTRAPREEQVFSHLQLVPVSDRRLLLVIVTRSGAVRQTVIDTEKPIAPDALYTVSQIISRELEGCAMSQLPAEACPAGRRPGRRDARAAGAAGRSAAGKRRRGRLAGGRRALQPAEFPGVFRCGQSERVAQRAWKRGKRSSPCSPIRERWKSPFVSARRRAWKKRRTAPSSRRAIALSDGTVNTIGLIGPTRMQYGKVLVGARRGRQARSRSCWTGRMKAMKNKKNKKNKSQKAQQSFTERIAKAAGGFKERAKSMNSEEKAEQAQQPEQPETRRRSRRAARRRWTSRLCRPSLKRRRRRATNTSIWLSASRPSSPTTAAAPRASARRPFDDGRREAIGQLLPIVDNLERALAAAGEEENALKSGVEMVLRQTRDALTKMGVEEIDPQGKPFDAELMNAVMQGTAEEGEPGTVCMVLQKGYKLGERVIRHAMVKVVAG